MLDSQLLTLSPLIAAWNSGQVIVPNSSSTHSRCGHILLVLVKVSGHFSLVFGGVRSAAVRPVLAFILLSFLRECSSGAGGNDVKSINYGSGKAEDELA